MPGRPGRASATRHRTHRSTRPARPRSARAAGDVLAAQRSRHDAVGLLVRDHERIRVLLLRLEEADAQAKHGVFEQLLPELLVHADVEDELFYPALHAAVVGTPEDAIFFQAREEHKAVDRLVYLMRDEPDPRIFAAQCMVLRDEVESHIQEEESILLPKAIERLGSAALESLGLRIAQRRAELLDDGAEPLFAKLEAKVRQQVNAEMERVMAAHHGVGKTPRPQGGGHGVTLAGTDSPGRAAYE